MSRHITAFAAAAALTAISAMSAFGHAGLEPSTAAPGSYRATITVPHGCDGQSTQTVKVVLPEGFINGKPMPKPGWNLKLDKGDYAKTYKLHGKDMSSGLKSVTWSGGDLSDDNYDEFVIKGSLDAETGARLPFIVTQLCANGQVVWDEIPADGQDPHSLEHPAPAVVIQAKADMHGAHGAADGQASAGDIGITGGWLRAMLPGQPVGGGYLTIANTGKDADRLVAVSTTAAGKSEIHEMSMNDGVMKMRPVEGGIEIPAGQTVELKQGGLHLMFMQVAKPFAEGDTVTVTLEFEKAGKIEIVLPVKTAADGQAEHKH